MSKMRKRSQLRGYVGKVLRGTRNNTRWHVLHGKRLDGLFSTIEEARAQGATKCCPRFDRV